MDEQRPTRARIRLTEESSEILTDLLEAGLVVFWQLRAKAVEDGESTYHHNRRIRVTRRILDEVERTREEAGWLTSE